MLIGGEPWKSQLSAGIHFDILPMKTSISVMPATFVIWQIKALTIANGQVKTNKGWTPKQKSEFCFIIYIYHNI